EPSLRILAACVLITGGAALAAKSLLLRKAATGEANA
ncbi:EamA family transporter, partial [Mesorhizobium sp. M00.F.Ca.ET.186.01.1.1]